MLGLNPLSKCIGNLGSTSETYMKILNLLSKLNYLLESPPFKTVLGPTKIRVHKIIFDSNSKKLLSILLLIRASLGE